MAHLLRAILTLIRVVAEEFMNEDLVDELWENEVQVELEMFWRRDCAKS